MLMLKKLSLVAMVAGTAVFAAGCGSSTSVRFDGYEVASLQPSGGGMMLAAKKAEPAKAPALPAVLTKALAGLYECLVPEARAAVSSAKFCFKEIRVKREDGNNSDGDKNQSIDVGLVTMDESGTDLTEIELESGAYKLIEFDLKDECDTGYSVSVDNDNGTITTDAHLQIRFSGTYDPDEDGDVVTLKIQDVMDTLDTVAAEADIDDIEDVDGTF